MTGLDARFLYSETPTGHMHTLKIAVMDLSGRDGGPLKASDFVDLLAARLDRLPVLRRRAVEVPYRLGHPVWVEDPDFDIARHVHWRVAHGTGTDRDLAQVIAEIAAVQLPRDRPLWDLTVVEGLAGGRVAYVMKLHHALADGGAAVALLENAFVLDDDEAYVERSRPEPLPERATLVRHALSSGTRRALEVPDLARRTVTGFRAARATREAIGLDLPGMFSAPRTSLNASLQAERTFAMFDLPLDDLLDARRALGCSLNDVFLAVCGGALRRYLGVRGELPPAGLVASVPMGTGQGVRHYSGNHVDNLVLPIGTEVADPAERARRVHEAAVGARKVREAFGTDLFASRAALTPPMLYPLSVRLWSRTRLADLTRPPLSLVASNVRGPTDLPTIDGARVTALYSIGPILEGIGLNITAWSFRNQLHVSVLGCPRTLPEPWELVNDLEVAASELVGAARAAAARA